MEENKNTNTNPVDMRVTGVPEAKPEGDKPAENTNKGAGVEVKATTDNSAGAIGAGNIGIVIPNANASFTGEISEEVKKAAEKYAEMYGNKKEEPKELTKEEKAAEMQKELDSLNLDEGTYVADSAPITQAMEALENRKKKSLKFLIIGLVAVLAIVIGIIGLNYKVIANSIKKKSMSPEEYTQYVINKNAKKSVELYRNMYEKHILNGLFSDNVDVTASLSFQITENGFDFLDDMDVDVDDIEDLEIFKDSITVSYSGKHYKDLSAISLTFSSGKKAMYSADIIFDKPNQMVYIGFPEFGNDYAAINLEDFYTDEEIEDLYTIISSIDHVGEILISGEQLEKILTRYEEVVVANIDDVEMSTETLKVGALEKKVTALEIAVDSDLAVDIITAVAEELIEDEEIKKIVEDISTIEYIEDADEFVEGYEDMLDEMDDMLGDIDDLADDMDFDMTITLYVDNKGNIIGTRQVLEYEKTSFNWDLADTVTTDTTTESFAGYIVSGNKFAIESITKENDEEIFTISGEGKVSGTKLSGTFTVEADEEEFEFEISGLDWSKYNKGIIDAKISFSFDQFGKEVPKAVRDLVVVININGSKDTYGVELLNEDTLLMKVEYKTEIKKANLSIPKNTVSIESADDIEEYVDDLDLSTLEDMLDDMDIDNADDILDYFKENIGDLIDENLPIESLLITEIGIPTNPVIPITAGVMAPELLRYVAKARISEDIILADSIKTAVTVAISDPSVITADDGSQDSIDELTYGVDITKWGKPSNKFQESIADSLGISDFSKLDKEIKSKYSGEGIWVTYDLYYTTIVVEFKNTDRYGYNDLSGYYNITSSSY